MARARACQSKNPAIKARVVDIQQKKNRNIKRLVKETLLSLKQRLGLLAWLRHFYQLTSTKLHHPSYFISIWEAQSRQQKIERERGMVGFDDSSIIYSTLWLSFHQLSIFPPYLILPIEMFNPSTWSKIGASGQP